MKKIYIMLLIVVIVSATACKKDWMAEKRDISLVVPSSLQDARRLLNDVTTLRKDHRMLASLAADEYYLRDATYSGIAETIAGEAYVWKDPTFTPQTAELFWGGPYKQVFYANIVLECLESLTPRPDQQDEYNDVKGAALFLRARAFYTLATQFSEPYVRGVNDGAMGIPLRLRSDISAPVVRNSLGETYAQIIVDLKDAIDLLRADVPRLKLLVSRPAAMGLLARCYLSMADYESAYEYANACLQLYDKLIDYNSLDVTLRFPIPLNNEEVIHDSDMQPLYINNISPYAIVDSVLYSLYDRDDVRKSIFFAEEPGGFFNFRGVYLGDIGLFGGIGVNEVFLIRAECATRLGYLDIALKDMNTLLAKRYPSGAFKKWALTNGDELLTNILLERRKELLFRGLRWEDLRRLNRESGREEMLTRTVNGETYTLQPNDSQYVFKIPESVIMETGIEQNR